MSRGGRQWAVTDHDVLGGRGVSVSQHAGNERFRALVYSRADADYCNTYTTEEKKAVAEEIVDHINSLDPPGRFLRRPKGFGSSGSKHNTVEDPWEELSRNEAIKKTCQALRDCNRRDRTGYGASVAASELPPDVAEVYQTHAQSGMTKKQLAEQAAETSKRKAETQFEFLAAQEADGSGGGLPLPTMDDIETTPSSAQQQPPSLDGDLHLAETPTPAVASFAATLMSVDHSSVSSPKRQRLLPEVTPSPGAVAPAAAMGSSPENPSSIYEDSSPLEPGFVLASTFDDAKPRASSFDTDSRPRAASLLDEDAYRAAFPDHEFGPPSPPYEEPTLNDFDEET